MRPRRSAILARARRLAAALRECELMLNELAGSVRPWPDKAQRARRHAASARTYWEAYARKLREDGDA